MLFSKKMMDIAIMIVIIFLFLDKKIELFDRLDFVIFLEVHPTMNYYFRIQKEQHGVISAVLCVSNVFGVANTTTPL